MPASERRLSERDFEMFSHLGIPPELLERAGVERVTDHEARETYGINGRGDRAGLIFPYFSRHDGPRVSARLRRDNPPIEAGKPKAKYLCPFGDKRHLYFVRGVNYDDPDRRLVLVEAEKSALALTALSERTGLKIATVAMGGCWGWKGRIGKVETSNGQRVDECGPLPDLEVCRDRDVVIMPDSNIARNQKVRAAQRSLVATLLAMDAKVRIATIPEAEGINGPDDVIAVMGDDFMRRVVDGTRPAAETATDDSRTAIALVKQNKHNADLIREALDAVAAIPDKLQRELMEAELAAAVRGMLYKDTVHKEILAGLDKQQKGSEERRRQISEAELLNRPLNAKQLIADLERFFAERLYLPDGAALVLTYFALNTYTFAIFDTTPYLCLESAVPDCGKTTVFRLLEWLCPDAHRATALTEASLFRLIDAGKPILLIDEAKILESKSERADILRAILDEGYKAGGQVPRCDGENHEIRWFDVYAPKAIAEIGGLSGALLDRSIVIHMERAPHGHSRKSTRVRALKRDSAPLVEQMNAYAQQARAELQKLYDAEPDEGYWPKLETREAELYGPLLIHAKLIGKDAEQKLLTEVEKFTQAKAKIQAEDLSISKAIAVLECLEEMCGPKPKPHAKFAPVDLLDALVECEAWAPTFGKAKGADEQTRRKGMAAKVGYFLKSFRLEKQKGTHRIEYDLPKAIDVIRRHVPVKPSEPSEASADTSQAVEKDGTCDCSDTSAEGCSAKVSAPQIIEKDGTSEGSDTSECFAGGSGNIDSEPRPAPDVDPSDEARAQEGRLFDAVVDHCRKVGSAGVTDLIATFEMTRIEAIHYIDVMEQQGLIPPANGTGPRPFLSPAGPKRCPVGDAEDFFTGRI